MKKHLPVLLTLIALIFTFTATAVVTPADANTLKFTENYVQKVLCSSYYGCDIFDGGKFKITAKLPLAGIDITKFNRNTQFSIYVGYFGWDCQLGDDTAYTPGKTSAQILVRTEEPDYYGRMYQYLQIRLKWNAKQLTIIINGITPDSLVPIWADDYLYENAVVNDVTDAYIEFGDDVKVMFYDIYIKGKAKTKYVKKYGWDVSNIKLNGTGRGEPYIGLNE
jgi:hypothetical protein